MKTHGAGKKTILKDMKNNKWQAFWLADNFRLWRSWITQQIPILKNGGSNPLRRAKENDKFLSELVVFSYIRLQRVILLRSYICLATSDIRFASFNGEYNITETIRFQYHFHAVKISLNMWWLKPVVKTQMASDLYAFQNLKFRNKNRL